MQYFKLKIEVVEYFVAQLKLSYDINFASKYFPIGRLAFKVEGGGKTRIFAIPNSFKQALMRPFHDWCMSVLKKMRMDGTYNQLGPLERLKGVKKLYYFYLSSATDRFPLWIQLSVVHRIFNLLIGYVWVACGLGFHYFNVVSSKARRL